MAYALTYGYIKGRRKMNRERHVSLFKNGRNQAIRIPREFELPGTEAIIRKEGACLVIEPIVKGKLLSLLATMEPVDEVFPDIDADLPLLDDIDL